MRKNVLKLLEGRKDTAFLSTEIKIGDGALSGAWKRDEKINKKMEEEFGKEFIEIRNKFEEKSAKAASEALEKLNKLIREKYDLNFVDIGKDLDFGDKLGNAITNYLHEALRKISEEDGDEKTLFICELNDLAEQIRKEDMGKMDAIEELEGVERKKAAEERLKENAEEFKALRKQLKKLKTNYEKIYKEDNND